jgi:hypothetical protein
MLRALSDLVNSMYIGAFRNAINAGGSDYYSIEIGQGFIKRFGDWLHGSRVAARESALELVKLIQNMFGYAELSISANPQATSLVFTINGRSFLLSELGSGIAQFVMVLANVVIKRPKYVFIDEPELNLHPSLQRDFLIALGIYTDKVVFATHSLGLAMSDAGKVYSIIKVAQGNSEVHEYGQTPRLSEFIGQLSYAGYKELGFDSILLVEGPTEVKVFQHFLHLFCKAHKVVIVQLGGSNLINGKRKEELAEVLKICTKVAAIVDSDRTVRGGESKQSIVDFEAVCRGLDIRCLILDRFATENYLTDAAVKKELGDSKTALPPYAKIDKAVHWDKDINWKIARHMTRSDLEATDLGPS